MGCLCSKANERHRPTKRPAWTSTEQLTAEKLQAMRDEFWDTQPHYGGSQIIWDALKAACEADLETARTIVDSAGIVVSTDDMSVCYDERGVKYELPLYVLSAPRNLVHLKKQTNGPMPLLITTHNAAGEGSVQQAR